MAPGRIGRAGARAERLAALAGDWDLIVIGGGITGAGIFREAAARGWRTLLLEQSDFASGTSSRSSKLVHGGLRYLATNEWRLTVHSVREREQLLQHGAGLIERQGFLLPVWRGQKPGWWSFRAGLAIYDRIARKRLSRVVRWSELRELAPNLSTAGMRGALYMEDARTDDARLVLRLIQEGCQQGGQAVNYMRVHALLREQGKVCGLQWQDALSGQEGEARAKVVINAGGVWAQHHGGEKAPKLRPLRGSHLLFRRTRLQLPVAVSWLHPRDGRPVFAYEWEGASLLGTTDLDHADSLDLEPHISGAEVDYLLEAAAHVWPRLHLNRADVLSTYAGVRPVVSSGAERPQDESRESALWSEPGLVSVTGGKLTTFRLTALDALRAAAENGGGELDLNKNRPILDSGAAPTKPAELSGPNWRRLFGRYGSTLAERIAQTPAGLLNLLPGTPYIQAELLWAAQDEAVEHLDDLLLRRTRIGLVAEHGGFALLDRVRTLCQSTLGWDDARWDAEDAQYRARWESHYSLPEPLA